MLCIADDPGVRVRALAVEVVITERTAPPIHREAVPQRHRDSGSCRRGAPIGSTSRTPVLPDIVRRVRSAVATARAEDVFLYSAALAFYGLISVAPLVVVALWVTSLLVGPTQIDQAAAELARFSPQALGADRALERVADLGTRLGLVAVVAAVWPATAYGSALVRVLDRLAGNRDATGLRRRGAALLLVCLAPVLMLASLVASYAGATALGDTPGELAVGLTAALVYGFGATVVTVGAIYRVFPAPRSTGARRSTARSSQRPAFRCCPSRTWLTCGSAPTSSAGTHPMLWRRLCCSACGSSPPTRRCSSAIEPPAGSTLPPERRGSRFAVRGLLQNEDMVSTRDKSCRDDHRTAARLTDVRPTARPTIQPALWLTRTVARPMMPPVASTRMEPRSSWCDAPTGGIIP
jgi:hypothetical protein